MWSNNKKTKTVRDEPLAMASMATRKAQEEVARMAKLSDESMVADGWVLCSRLDLLTVWERGGRFVACIPGAVFIEVTP